VQPAITWCRQRQLDPLQVQRTQIVNAAGDEGVARRDHRGRVHRPGLGKHTLGGMHAPAWDAAELIGHASLIQRRLLQTGQALRRLCGGPRGTFARPAAAAQP